MRQHLPPDFQDVFFAAQYHPTQSIAMPVHIFGQAMDDKIRTQSERLLQCRAGKS